MRERAFGAPTSMMASREFYFAPVEHWSPEAELRATIEAMVAAGGGFQGNPDKHPACLFPARAHWLRTKLPGFAAAVPQPACPAFEHWREPLRTQSVSLVFSAYFSGNPASMFGHSFLRLHKRPVPGQIVSDMLDNTLNFMAYPTTDNPVLYALAGLLGRFPGRFSIAPLYMKIQEYNNSESRDLWEYELGFGREDIDNLTRVMWEIGPQTIRYYYFDENCSLILLAVLEAAKPAVFLPALHPWVIPSDTLRALERSPGLVKKVAFRPSALTRFLARYHALGPDLRGVVDRMVSANDPEEALGALHFLAPAEQAAVIDAAVDFIDFDENLAGSKMAEKYAALRRALLTTRAGLKVERREVQPELPPAEAPHLTHGTTRIGGGPGYAQDGGAFVQAEWRPAQHDLASPDLGYPEGLAITFFDTALRAVPAEKKLYLQRYDLLTIFSVPHTDAVIGSRAWTLQIGAENLGDCGVVSFGCYSEHIRGGLGPEMSLGAATLYALAEAEAGFSGEHGMRVNAGPLAAAGVIYPLSPTKKLSANGNVIRRYGVDGAVRNEYRAEGNASFLLNDAFEVRVTAARRPTGTEGLAELFYYY